MPCGNTSTMPAPDALGPRLGRPRRGRYAEWRAVSAHCLCANGLSFDVLVGSDCECWPREDKGPWTHVEVIGINRSLSSLERYRDTKGSPHAVTRHFKVPLDELNRLIARNGGLK